MEQQNHIFIDPENCGSSVGYYITLQEYTPNNKTKHTISASVVLSDCSHKIDWSFGTGDIDKIDNTIHMLQEFRKKFMETEKLVDKLNK